MKIFLFKIALFFAIVIACDFLIGKLFDNMVNSIKIGGQGRDNYICNQSKDDILIFGSSRAVHHYNSQILEDSLGMSCYNCGEDGEGILLNYGRYMMVKKRHQPKIIIYDVAAGFDLLLGDNHEYLGWLKARYDNDCIRNIINDIDPLEKYKMMCSCYRYNSKIVQNLFVFLTGISSDTGIKGYRPLKMKFNPMKIKERTIQESYEYDSVKTKYIELFIKESKGAQLYFVKSPMWYASDSTHVSATQWLEEVCRRENIPFVDFSYDPKYVNNNDLFKDGTHLNSKGADEFTRDLIKYIKHKQ